MLHGPAKSFLLSPSPTHSCAGQYHWLITSHHLKHAPIRYDGAPLLDTWDPRRWISPWAKGPVALCGDAAHPMMPNLGQASILLTALYTSLLCLLMCSGSAACESSKSEQLKGQLGRTCRADTLAWHCICKTYIHLQGFRIHTEPMCAHLCSGWLPVHRGRLSAS